jgi:hypothetical protein
VMKESQQKVKESEFKVFPNRKWKDRNNIKRKNTLLFVFLYNYYFNIVFTEWIH